MFLMLGIEIPDDDDVNLESVTNRISDTIRHFHRFNCANAELHVKKDTEDFGDVLSVSIKAPSNAQECDLTGAIIQDVVTSLVCRDDKYDDYLLPAIKYTPYHGDPIGKDNTLDLYANFAYPYDSAYVNSPANHIELDITLPNGMTAEQFLEDVYDHSEDLFTNDDLIRFFQSEVWFRREDSARIEINMLNSNAEQVDAQIDAFLDLNSNILRFLESYHDLPSDEDDDE